jgi:hypothetical protein
VARRSRRNHGGGPAEAARTVGWVRWSADQTSRGEADEPAHRAAGLHDLDDTRALLEIAKGLADDEYRAVRLPGLTVLSWDGPEESIAAVLENVPAGPTASRSAGQSRLAQPGETDRTQPLRDC